MTTTVDKTYFNISLKVLNHITYGFVILELGSCKITLKKCPITYEHTCKSYRNCSLYVAIAAGKKQVGHELYPVRFDEL